MKKLVLSLAILGFVAFGVINIQNVIASSVQTEMVNFDKDPKKEDTKKAADTKEVKAEMKSGDCAKSCAEAYDKSCASACSSKSASAKSCCSGEKASTVKADSPDVK